MASHPPGAGSSKRAKRNPRPPVASRETSRRNSRGGHRAPSPPSGRPESPRAGAGRRRTTRRGRPPPGMRTTLRHSPKTTREHRTLTTHARDVYSFRRPAWYDMVAARWRRCASGPASWPSAATARGSAPAWRSTPPRRLPRRGGDPRRRRAHRRGVVGRLGPSVGASLAFGYVRPEHAAPGTELEVLVLGERRPARVLAEARYDSGNLRPRS